MLKAAGLAPLALASTAMPGTTAMTNFPPPKSRRSRFSPTRCSGYEGLKKEEQGVYEIDDAKCKMGTVDIKLDKDYKVVVISAY
jgi:hypothetical protein